jgi:hypothetical protein
MIRRWITLVCLFAALASTAITPESSHSARQKLDRIAERKLAPGASLVLSEDEINSYLRYDYAPKLPAGVSEPYFRLEPDHVKAGAMVDFLEWQVQKGASPGLLLSWLLRGKRRVEGVGRYTSADSYGRTDIESVKIDGIPISAQAVTFLIENLVAPRFPGAVVGRSVPLDYNLKQVRIERGRAVVVAR